MKAKTRSTRRIKTIQKKVAQKKVLQHKNRNHIYLAIAVLCICLAVISFLFIRSQKRINPPETPRNNMKRLPLEIKHALTYASPSATFRVPVLLYHYVEYVQDKRDTTRQSLDIIPAIFDEQVKTLKNAGYTFMTAKDLGDVLDGKKQLPPNPILLTFDDGHWDLDTDVLPILKKYQVKATAYIIPGFLGGSDFLSIDQLKDVAASGLVEIGAHTVHHLWLKGLPLAKVQSEVDDSKTMLEQLIHTPVVSFAYPYGAFDEQAEQVVKDDGFATAVSTLPGVEVNQADRFFVYRLRPGGRTGAVLINYLNSSFHQQY